MTAEEKKRMNAKAVVTNIFMAVSVLAIAAALTLVAMGYRLEGGELTQYGMVQVNSVPSGAGVEIDGEKIANTEMSKLLPGGTHGLVVTKPGYDVWRGEVAVESGLLKRVDWVRLFPIDKVVEVVGEYEDLNFVAGMPGRSGLLLVRNGTAWTVVENVDGRTVSKREVVVPEWLVGKEILTRKWDKDGDRLFVRTPEGWGMVDLRTNGESMNITQGFSLAIEDIVVANDAGNKIYALENGNLRVIDLQNRSVSDVRVAGVTAIGGEGETVGYVQFFEGVRTVGAYRDGETGGKEIVRPEGEGARVRMWRYWGEDVMAGVVDGKLVVMRGMAYGDMKEMLTMDIDEAARDGAMVVSPSGRFLAFAGRVIDVSSGEFYEVAGGRGWLDDFLIYAIREGRLDVWDFDGGNERSINEARDDDVMISRENGWLYYVEKDGGKVMREKL